MENLGRVSPEYLDQAKFENSDLSEKREENICETEFNQLYIDKSYKEITKFNNKRNSQSDDFYMPLAKVLEDFKSFITSEVKEMKGWCILLTGSDARIKSVKLCKSRISQ
jgi:hypothetical protein